QPDLILLDIGLPKLNGIEVGRRIRKVSSNAGILFLSQESSADVVQEAFRLGAQGYLHKSDVAGELLLAVDAVLQGKQFISKHLKAFTNTREAHAGDSLRRAGRWKASGTYFEACNCEAICPCRKQGGMKQSTGSTYGVC